MAFYLRIGFLASFWGLGVLIFVKMDNLESYPTTTDELAQCQALLLQCQVNALALVPVRGIPVGPAPPANPEPSVKDPL